MASRQPTEAGDPDFFPTGPWAFRAIAEFIKQHLDPGAVTAWEAACGAGHGVHGLRGYFPHLWASDKYPYDGNRIHDFLDGGPPICCPQWIITNPPFGDLPEAFIRRAYEVATHGVAILGRAALLETIGRYSLLYRDCPLTVFAPFSERLALTKGRWEPDASSAAFYAWFVFVKPRLGMNPRRFMARIGGSYFPATWPIAPGTEARLTHADDARLFGAQDRSRGAA